MSDAEIHHFCKNSDYDVCWFIPPLPLRLTLS
jgi:hypothetical protein